MPPFLVCVQIPATQTAEKETDSNLNSTEWPQVLERFSGCGTQCQSEDSLQRTGIPKLQSL